MAMVETDVSRPAKRRKLGPSSENLLTNRSVSESTQFSDLTKDITIIADLQDDCSDINLSPRREKMEATSRVSTEEKSPSSEEKMPSERELEEFFSAAEKQIHKKFTDKYNFDVAKEVPLQGRYEWVQIIP